MYFNFSCMINYINRNLIRYKYIHEILFEIKKKKKNFKKNIKKN